MNKRFKKETSQSTSDIIAQMQLDIMARRDVSFV